MKRTFFFCLMVLCCLLGQSRVMGQGTPALLITEVYYDTPGDDQVEASNDNLINTRTNENKALLN